jgi:pimeloyl-ACP methyl ester carboxylesterase
VRPAARLRRTYFDSRYGQLHVHQAIPPGGGFDEATALLCIPGMAGEGRFFQALLGPLGADRSIYAPDLPGCGQSDAPTGAVGSEQHALALLDLLDSLRQRRVDVLAQATGAEVAVALATLRPGTLLRRVACSAPPPRALESLRQQGLEVREVNLAPAGGDVPAATAAVAQIHDLIEFFGAASTA